MRNYSNEELRAARNEGYQAYLDGADENPYNNNEQWPLNRAWYEGWCDAAWDD